MTDARAPTVRDLANEAEAHVVKLVPAALERLLTLSLGSDDAPEGVALMTDALTYFRRDFAAAFKALGLTLTQDVVTAQATMTEALSGVVGRLPRGAETPDPDHLRDLSVTVLQVLQPAITAFLSELFTFVVATEKAQARRITARDTSAVEQISDISDKINLIAINASIEAARAGEVGKGFAVIASEIQDLSRQSSVVLDKIRTELVQVPAQD